jgi:hypothetical protein
MDRQAADRHADRRRRERLDLELAEVGAVERVGDVRAECVEVEVLGAAPDLLVHRERDADRRARALAVASEAPHRSHDLGDPGLVVGAEERRPVARHEVVTDTRRERRENGRIEDLSRITRQHDRVTSPRLVDDRRDVGADDVRGRVHVRDQPHHRGVDRSRESREHGVALVQLRVRQPQLAQLLDEQP